MIDHLDKKTQSLPLEPKRGRGRPANGQALSNAERQRLYRERQKAKHNEKPATGPTWEEARALAAQIDSTTEELNQAKARVGELETQLAQRNEKTSKASPAPEQGVWTVRFKVKRSRTWVMCEPQIDFEGKPWSYEETREHVNRMAKSHPDHTWQAVRNDGLIYDPKAAK